MDIHSSNSPLFIPRILVLQPEEEIWDELILAGTLILSIECEPGSLPEAPGPRR